jgi:cytochrome c peroxidase
MRILNLVLFFAFIGFSFVLLVTEKHPFYIPKHFPKPVYQFKDVPQGRLRFELGRTLFYDPALSRDSSISCATCHLQYTGFTHIDHPVSHGIDGKIGTRNSPVLINLAWNKFFHWDGGVTHLNAQSINPLTHPKEMDMDIVKLLERLNNSSFYRQRFYDAFGDSNITTPLLMRGIANFSVALVSANSEYDKVIIKEKGVAFTEQEQRGYDLFKKYCNACHTEPLFTSHDFKKNGLELDPELKDIGRMGITERKSDSLLFKIPTLRNVEFSFPYMHDGRITKLKDVIEHYSSLAGSSKNISKELKKIKKPFTDEEKKDLLTFLKTLTDKEFLYNKDFSFPREELKR